MKRVVVCLLVVALACSALVGIAQGGGKGGESADAQVYQVVTPKGQLNVRSQPNARSRVVGQLSNRSLVRVLAEDSGFFQVQLTEERTGWARAEFLMPTPYGEDALAYRPLQIGSRGEEVRALKARLLQLGYYRDHPSMSDTFNATCAVRVRLFQKLNDLDENGIATPAMQAVLFSAQAKENTEEIPATRRILFLGGHSGLSQDDAFDWNRFARENPGVCMCCTGKGCECCNFTGRID